MKRGNKGERLVRELLVDPRGFEERGRSYDLLQACFGGFSPECLRPLLTHKDVRVQRVGVFVASELGTAAQCLVDDVVPLTRSGVPYIRYAALEVLAVCCTAEGASGYAHVIRALEDEDSAVRVLVMSLVSNADVSQLDASARFFREQLPRHLGHEKGLSVLLEGDRVDAGLLAEMVTATAPLDRKYGAIALCRRRQRSPELFLAVASSEDGDLREFADLRARQGLVGA